MIERLRGLGDQASADILELILSEEVAHVGVGSRWFHWLCSEQGIPPQRSFIGLVRQHARGALRGPFNRPARRAAGFDDAELDALEGLAIEGNQRG
jgi:uncharacterized ferritin-like protein (DUF455 family)